ncbi:hypothetical protein OH76DRAFT_943931 [Lentinus brumalis]|uniref:Uncharacterized protein n=1 Tax=Lentinus brumalis TaxID=2498619 RepID=A0A371CZ13_9APHY|nr:hypothetical protein OH76DRAFT_943931 [Polyporus brumalis]
MTGRPGEQGMRHDRPTRRARYGTQAADQESKVWDASSRPGVQGTGRDQPTKKVSYSTSVAEQRQACACRRAREYKRSHPPAWHARWPRRRAHRPATSLLTRHHRHSSPGSNIERHTRLACLAETQAICRGISIKLEVILARCAKGNLEAPVQAAWPTKRQYG